MNKPEYLYKFRKIDSFSEDILCHNSIYLSSPQHFNDPFDSSVDLIKIPDEKTAKTLYNKLNQEIKKEISNFNVFKNNEYDYWAHKIWMMKEINVKLNKIGVCCFSCENNNILAWSHYANQHKGICIQFKPNYNKFPFNQILKVTYDITKPQVPFESESYDNIIKVKFNDWHYESEYRIIDYNKSNCSIAIDPSEITGVILGYKSSQAESNTIINWIKRSNSKPTLYKADKDWQNYNLKIEPYPKRRKSFREALLNP